MPRRTATRCARRVAESRVVDPNLRELLTAGMPFFQGDEDPYRTRQEWADAWAYYGEQVLPAFIEKHPGRRPAAMYAAGILPPIPLQQPLPAAHGFTVVAVEQDDRSIVKHLIRPCEPWAGCEAEHLYGHGAITLAELELHRNHWTHHSCEGVTT